MKSIVTLTVNPTVDINTDVSQVLPEKKLRCGRPRRDPGGGGVNVARAVHRLGGDATALYLAGGPPGEMLCDLLEGEGVAHRALPVDEWTRENLIVYEEASGLQYRFGMPGPTVEEAEWRRCLDELAALDPTPDYLVASGSLPPGMPEDFFGHVAEVARDGGAHLIVDTSGEPLRHAVEVGTFMLKPNLRELRELVGEELEGEHEQVDAARHLVECGQVEVLVLSLGAGGALVVTAESVTPIRTPTVPIRSKVGAGDSMVGGTVLALARGWELLAAVRFGVAAGAAAVMTAGTELCRREDTERLYAEMQEGMEGE
ncbi:MAG TPA: 1-phosphofructokinase family hexose kinase [Thermoleophilia bacterium]|nr:1-phosphofructokinase family hexose kinase [Thermoleophilia bacterium]